MAIRGSADRMRVVIVDPSYASPVGHHQELNGALLTALHSAGHRVEVWADAAVPAAPSLRAVSSDCGYLDPRHWTDLAGSLHLAQRLRQQFEAALDGPVDVWLAHGLLPFQQIALAQLLQQQAPAQVLVSLMFAPSETLGGFSGADAAQLQLQAGLTARTAHQALAQACRQVGHTLQIGSSSATTLALHAQALQAAGLGPGLLHPAVVGAGCQPPPPPPGEQPLVLLHWGDRKADKGADEALAVLRSLLQRPLDRRPPWRWLFHSFSDQVWDPEDRALLQQASLELGDSLIWLDEAVSSSAMQAWLAQCSVALLAYSASTYAERSSGVLWCYAAARYAVGLPAQAVGYGGHWLQREAQALGLGWSALSPAANSSDGEVWLGQIEAVMTQGSALEWSAEAEYCLGRSFSDWVLEQIQPGSDGLPRQPNYL